ncbi:unnamed protein product [Nippostrongylus brasiliensis]|uniref:Uncharacterized protein n=1 Tax=Nippostrongylus brasiliensis TaxID=27835 RepID=A0A0N4YPB9_NIPBR|nr:hypothetical protein Q1695_003350 [Nippostrongylus brasiliensis]VDL82823.1 unnamed protein product [Nippostrongylus brasiliensis]
MDILLLFILYALFFINFVSKCCKKKSSAKSKSNKRSKKKRDHQRRDESPMRSEQPPPGDQAPLGTARETPDGGTGGGLGGKGGGEDDTFKCRDYTPPIFNDLQQLFDLLKRS